MFLTKELLHLCGEERRGAFEVVAKMPEWLAAQPAGSDATFAEYLKRAAIDAALAERASAYVEGFNAADRNIIGVAALARQQRAENDIQADRIFRICRGYFALPQFLADKFQQSGGTIFFERAGAHDSLVARYGEFRRPGRGESSIRAQGRAGGDYPAARCIAG